MEKQYAFITGATSGIGAAVARSLAEMGWNLILCGRREERLAAIKSELSKRVEIVTLSFDVRDNLEVNKAIDSLGELRSSISILINSAGNAHGLSPIDEGDICDWDAMIDGNVKGLLYVSKPIIEALKSNGGGSIVNISSIAGKSTYPNGSVYCASKSAVEAISEGMRMDLAPHGIRVINIAPGAVETEFSLVRFKGDKERAVQAYNGYEPLKATDVADVIVYAVSAPKHVNIADVTILPSAQSSATTFVKS